MTDQTIPPNEPNPSSMMSRADHINFTAEEFEKPANPPFTIEAELPRFGALLILKLDNPAGLSETVLPIIRDTLEQSRSVALAQEALATMPLPDDLDKKLSDKRGQRSFDRLLSLNDEDLANFAIERIRFMHRQTAELKKTEELDAAAQLFDKTTRQFIEAGYLPLSTAEYEERTKDLGILIADPLYATTSDIVGVYRSSTNDAVIYGGLNLFKGEYKHALFHELTHAISGLTVGTTEDPLYYDPVPEVRRVGLRTGKNGRFHWANEAVTEVITQALLNEQEPATLSNFFKINDRDLFERTGYDTERLLLRLFLEKGQTPTAPGEVPVNKDRLALLLGAYFYDYNPQAPAHQKATPVKDFYQAMQADGSLEIWQQLNQISFDQTADLKALYKQAGQIRNLFGEQTKDDPRFAKVQVFGHQRKKF